MDPNQAVELPFRMAISVAVVAVIGPFPALYWAIRSAQAAELSAGASQRAADAAEATAVEAQKQSAAATLDMHPYLAVYQEASARSADLHVNIWNPNKRAVLVTRLEARGPKESIICFNRPNYVWVDGSTPLGEEYAPPRRLFGRDATEKEPGMFFRFLVRRVGASMSHPSDPFSFQIIVSVFYRIEGLAGEHEMMQELTTHFPFNGH